CSPWESKPENLHNFMEKIQPDYGWGNKAIEVGLAHVNREIEKGEVSQVILIGDASANTKEEVLSKRSTRGEQYWKNTKLFPTPTYCENELSRLKKHNVPVHAFFTGIFAKQGFAAIATATNGRCEQLDINSNRGSEQLTDLVSEEVLRNAGGANGNDFVEAYRAKFSKSFT
ncbi:hypothetical protein RFI_03835, partial [Reticulomyxa filosa]